MNSPKLPVVLILCTGNSCRSHLAEGILRQAAGDLLDVRSAGSKPAGYVHPLAIKVMSEIGIDISGHHSKSMDGFLQQAGTPLPVGALVTTRGADAGTPLSVGALVTTRGADAGTPLPVGALVTTRGAEAGAPENAHPTLTHSTECAYGRKQDVETVITVCGNADQACPMFPGQLNRHHWGFDDPAHALGDEEQQLSVFRRVRDEIKRVFEAYADGRRDAAKAAQGSNIGKESPLVQDNATGIHPDRIREQVRSGYATIAGKGGSCCSATPTCCGSSPAAAEELVRHIGYSADELAVLPEGANMGLSCGNPNALAALQPGEIVLDLGAGGGFDVFIASRNVGPTGRAIGVDMTPEMLTKARNNLIAYRERSGLDNVEFRLGEIEQLPVPDHSVDVVISNCVINLSPDKPQVWREISRVLKPGGRVAVSDLALLKPLPADVLVMVEALVGCVAGAVLVSDTERMAREAGLTELMLTAKPQYVETMTHFEDPLYQKIVALLPAGTKPSDYIVSLEVQARMPAAGASCC